jgi:hypothetical protein
MNSLGTDLADFNPPVDAGSIATLGVAVKSAYKLPEESKVLSGTSMATPIVASVAAMVVHFVRHLVSEPPEIKEVNYDKGVWKRFQDVLGERDVILEFLKLLSVKVPFKCNFLQPQTKFASRTAVMKPQAEGQIATTFVATSCQDNRAGRHVTSRVLCCSVAL